MSIYDDDMQPDISYDDTPIEENELSEAEIKELLGEEDTLPEGETVLSEASEAEEKTAPKKNKFKKNASKKRKIRPSYKPANEVGDAAISQEVQEEIKTTAEGEMSLSIAKSDDSLSVRPPVYDSDIYKPTEVSLKVNAAEREDSLSVRSSVYSSHSSPNISASGEKTDTTSIDNIGGLDDLKNDLITPNFKRSLQERSSIQPEDNIVPPGKCGFSGVYTSYQARKSVPQEHIRKTSPEDIPSSLVQQQPDTSSSKEKVYKSPDDNEDRAAIQEPGKYTSRQTSPITIPIGQSEIIAGKYNKGIIADSKENAGSAMLHAAVSGTYTPEGFYKGADFLASNTGFFNSRTEPGVRQGYSESPVVPPKPLTAKESSNIIAKEHNKAPEELRKEVGNIGSTVTIKDHGAKTINSSTFHMTDRALPLNHSESYSYKIGQGITSVNIGRKEPIGKTVNTQAQVIPPGYTVERKETAPSISAKAEKDNLTSRQKIETRALRKFVLRSHSLANYVASLSKQGVAKIKNSVAEQNATEADGADLIKKYSQNITSTVSPVLQVSGYRALKKALIQHDDKISAIAQKYSQDAKAMTKAEKHYLLRHKTEVMRVCGLKTQMLDLAKKAPNVYTESELKFLQSNKALNGARYAKQHVALINKYLRNSGEDIFKKINVAGLSPKQIKKLLKKNTFSPEVKRALKQLQHLKKLPSGKSFAIARDSLSRLGVLALSAVDPGAIREAMVAYNAGKVASKIGVFALGQGVRLVRFTGKVSGVSRALHFIGGKVHKKVQVVRNIAAKKVKTVKADIKTKASNTRAGKDAQHKVKSIRSSLNDIKTKAKSIKEKIGSSKPGKAAKKAGKTAKKVGKGAVKAGKVTGNIITAPFRWVSRAFNAIREAFMAVAKYVAIGLIIVALVYLLAVLISMASISLISAGSDISNLNLHYPMLENGDMEKSIISLNALDEKKYEEAMATAKGTPLSQEVFGGEKIYHYGSPEGKEDPEANKYHNYIADSETDNGFHIYFMDSAGRILGSNTTNTKDIISLTAVMMSNDLYNEASGSVSEGSLKTAFSQMTEKWSELLNPPVTYIESDIYHAPGSDVYPHGAHTYEQKIYYCTDESFYEGYRAVQHQTVNGQSGGVAFYTGPHIQTTHGCTFNEEAYNTDHEEWEDNEPEEPTFDKEEPDSDDYDSEEEYDEAVEEYNDAVDEYNEALGEYDDKLNEWRDAEPQKEDYYYCPGHPIYDEGEEDVRCSYGYRDLNVYVTVLTKDDVYAAANSNGIITYRVPTNFECTEWEEKEVDTKPVAAAHPIVTKDFTESNGWLNQNNIDWCEAMFDSDWYEMYGIDVYSDSVGLNISSGGLSQRQIQELIDSYDGELSEDREAFINYALNYVGQIDYYWGGKPSCPGWEGNEFGTRIKPDSKGRTIKGLDCSGYVGWVYWSVFDEKPGLSTANFCSSLSLGRTTADKLIPGDIGMMNLPGSKGTNHVGIFVGYDKTSGKPKWVHCEGQPSDTVICNTTNSFRYYYKLNH